MCGQLNWQVFNFVCGFDVNYVRCIFFDLNLIEVNFKFCFCYFLVYDLIVVLKCKEFMFDVQFCGFEFFNNLGVVIIVNNCVFGDVFDCSKFVMLIEI